MDKNDTQGKIRNANDYFQLLTQHIRKENKLFISWFKFLSGNDRALLFEDFEKIEERVIGIGKHEEYATNLEKMKLQIEQVMESNSSNIMT